MAKFTIYSPTGTALYTGTPSFTGQYMKPGLLEFREVSLPSITPLEPGCYVDYSRTGYRYRIYTVPQIKKQARALSYGGAFVYQGVQLYDASKMLEYCPFRDLVLGDNRIHFSTQPSISTFEGCDGLARRFEACLEDQYGTGSWAVRVATVEDDGITQEVADLMAEAREFTVSGINLLQALDKIYEIWPGIGWVYKVEDSVDTIIIGGGGTNPNTGTYAYGKGNGLTSLTRMAANAEEIANRIFAYGSSRNMLPRWYNSQNIKDAESVDIQNLMIPVSSWGTTDNLPDAAKAFVQDTASIAKNGLRPATVYFDGKGEYPEIYPSIRETTIGMVRTAIGDPTAKYYPSATIYTDPTARIDRLLSAQATFDSGLAGNTPGKANVEMGDTPFSSSGSFEMTAGLTYYPFYHYQGTWTAETAGIQTVAWKLDLSGQVQLDGIEKVAVSVRVKDPSYQGPVILSEEYELTPDASGVVSLSGKEMVVEKVNVSAVSYIVNVDISVYMTAQLTDKTGTYTANGNVGISLQNYRKKTFTISIRQVGFDINEQAELGEGKTIAMRTGKCAGRSFAIKSVQYNSATDSWSLECWRSDDESLSQWFPNTDYPVRGLENAGQSNEYPGDEFVLLDIAMPDIYISMAEQKLLTAANDLLADTAVERWQYVPEIDAKFMAETGRTILAGEYMALLDIDAEDITPGNMSYFLTSGGGYLLTANGEKIVVSSSSGEVIMVFVDSVVINEGEATIPTYKVTLRDRKKKTWTESESATQSSSKPVGDSSDAQTSSSSSVGGSFFKLDDSGNVTLKDQYQNLWVPGWMAAGGIGEGGGGGVTSLYALTEVESTTSPTQDQVFYFNGSKWTSVSLKTVGGTSLIGTGDIPVSGGSTVEVYNLLTTGTRVATIRIGGTSGTAYDILAPSGGGGGGASILNDLQDVTISSAANGDLLVYNSTSGNWENVTKATALSNYALKTGGFTYNFQVNSVIFSGGTLSGTTTMQQAHRLVYSYQEGGMSVDDPEVTVTKTIAFLDDIPTSLKNPYAITFGSKTYDGSEAKTILASDLGALTSHQTVTLASGTNNGTLKITTAAGTVDNIAVTGLQALAYKASLVASDIPDISGTYVTVATAQTVSGLKTFSAGLVTGGDIYPSADLGGSLGYSNRRFANGNIQTIGTTTIYLKNSNSGNSGQISASGGYLVVRVGADLNTSYKQLILHETYGFYPDGTGVNLGYSGANSRWQTIYGVNGNLTGDLTLASTSHIDLGPVRLEFANNALHVTTNDSTNYPSIGFYADGFVAAGGIQGSSVSYEVSNNKVTALSSSSTHTQYPSAKCVYDIVGNLETLLAAI